MIKINGVPIQTERFPNNETKYKDFAQNVKPADCLVELKFESDKDLIDLMFIKKRLDAIGKSSNLFVWYMPYSRMDRQIEGDLFTLDYVTDFIAGLGFKKVTVMEPHSRATMDLFKKHGQNAQDVYPTKDWIKNMPADHVVYPDGGAQQRYADVELENIVAFKKTRDPQTGRILRIEHDYGDVTKRSKCIILDDLCSKGGTFIGVGDTLKTMGAERVDLMVAHCEETIFDGDILKNGSPIDTVYTSDSILVGEHPKIKKLNINVGGMYGKEL